MIKENIKIKGHIGRWYVIDEGYQQLNGTQQYLYMLEHETYGDEAECLIIDKDLNLILDEVYNGWDDLEYMEDTRND